MKIISSVLFFILFTAALGQTNETTSTVTSESTSSVSSTEVTTTSDKTTPTTLETTATTESINTTDVPTITTPSTTSSSTTASSSTSDAPTSTLPPVTSTTTPEPEPCMFNVTEGGVTCIRAEMQAKFFIYAENTTHDIILGCNASYAGSDCSSSNETQTLVLSEPSYTLTMIFEKKAGKVLVNNVTFSYNTAGLTGFGSNQSGDLFNVKVGNSYKCKTKLDIHLDNITMEVKEVHVQAFIEEGKGYGAIQECDADEKVSDIVPIAVGVALAALIIIVLIAYLVGRRRSRQKGYQSV